MVETQTTEIIGKLRKFGRIPFKDSFEFAKIASVLLLDSKTSQEGQRIIINILDNWDKLDEQTKAMWIDLIEAAGLYPYLEKKNIVPSSTSGKIRKSHHQSQSNENRYFHEEQKVLNDLISEGKNTIVSAPTSFGKSLLIEEIVSALKYKNIVIIQPTLALLDETRRKLSKYKEQYKIIVRTSQRPSETKGNLFLLTAERVMEYKDLPKIDYLILDEFYKLSANRDDERSDVLNNAFYKLVKKFNCKFYLLGPNIDSISEGFAEKYNAEFFRTDYSTVDIDTIDIYEPNKAFFGERGPHKKYKENHLFKFLSELKENTLIYCSSPARVRFLSRAFTDYLKSKNVPSSQETLPIISWIKENVSPEWSLIDCLRYKVGIHDGALPKHINITTIDYFNSNKLKYLFCTTTIIEGVNTSAKNVIFFDPTKGTRKPIDYFDYTNIKGRAGRFLIHYTGRIFDFNPKIQREKINIDIPFFEQNPVRDEVLIHLDEEDVKSKDSPQYKRISNLPTDEKQLFKKNGVSVWGQKAILDKLDAGISRHYKKIHWKGFPEYEQLNFIIALCWENFIKKGETVTPMNKKWLAKIVFDYGINQDISVLINARHSYLKTKYDENKNRNSIRKVKTDVDLLDDAVKFGFQIQKHWLEYKVPKWIGVFNEIQKFVCEKNNLDPGEYSYYAGMMENDFAQENLAILLEFGIPSSAVKKLKKYVPKEIPEEQITDYIKKNNLSEKADFLEYEKNKIEENLI